MLVALIPTTIGALLSAIGIAGMDRLVRRNVLALSATDDPQLGLSGGDILWVLERAEAEVLILRPAPQDTRVITPAGISGHF